MPQSPSITTYQNQNTIPLNNVNNFNNVNNINNVQSNNNQDSYGTPVTNPLGSNNQDSYGTPLGNPINNNIVQSVGNSYNVGNTANNVQNPFLTQNTNTNINAIPAPSTYASPNTIRDYSSEILTPSPRAPKQHTGFPSGGLRNDPGTTLATIKVVNPPADIVGRGPFIPSDPPLKTNIDDNVVHPNQLVHSDFKPSVRLPDNFVHQIGK